MFLLSSFYFLIICLSHFDIVDFPHAWSSWLSIHVYEWIFRKLIESSVYIYRTFQLVDFMVGSLGWQGFSIGNLQMSESVVYEFGSWSVFSEEISFSLDVFIVQSTDFHLISLFSFACLTSTLSFTSCLCTHASSSGMGEE